MEFCWIESILGRLVVPRARRAHIEEVHRGGKAMESSMVHQGAPISVLRRSSAEVPLLMAHRLRSRLGQNISVILVLLEPKRKWWWRRRAGNCALFARARLKTHCTLRKREGEIKQSAMKRGGACFLPSWHYRSTH